MSQENKCFKSWDFETAAKARWTFDHKRFSTEGKNIPLKKDWSESWCTLPSHYDTLMDQVLNFELRADDVFVSTFMKSGTTWMQECVWLLMNNLDYEQAKQKSIMLRSPYLEGLLPNSGTRIKDYSLVASPRLFKCHLPANLMPFQVWQKKQKVIYVARNVKDVIVSSYHFIRDIKLWAGESLIDYVNDFMNNDVLQTPYWTHVLNFWFMRHEPFIFFVTYEEMKRDLASVCQRLCKFLERPPLTAEELEKFLDHVSFGSMKKNSNGDIYNIIKRLLPETKDDFQFVRRGIVGSFKDELTPELIAKIDKWSADILNQYGLKEEDIFGKL